VSQATPSARLIRRIAALPPDAARLLDAALARAEVLAGHSGKEQLVEVQLKVQPWGIAGLACVTEVTWRDPPAEGGRGAIP
jgi:hypothetical protein